MSKVPTRNISFTAGQTFIDQALWCQGSRVYKPISDILYGLPTVIKVVDHGVPEDIIIAVWFENMNSKSFLPGQVYFAAFNDANHLTILDHNSYGIKAASLGSIYYIPPISTTDMVFATQFRRTVNSPLLLEIRSDGLSPGFTLLGNGIVSMQLTPAQTRLLIGTNKNPISGIAQVEATNDLDEVSRPWDYAWEVYPEGTQE